MFFTICSLRAAYENSFFEFQGNLIYRSPFSVNYDFSRGNKKPSINIADESDPGIIFDGNETYHLLVPMELYEASKLLALKAYLVDEITKNKRIWYTAIVNPIFGANLDDGSNLLCPYVLLDFDSINQVGDGIVFNKFGDLERELFKETMNENRRKLS